jgi:hypothetical protein
MSIIYKLANADDISRINEDECIKNIFKEIIENNKKYLFFIVNNFEQKVLIENSNIENLNDYKKKITDIKDFEKKHIKIKEKDKDNKDDFFYELGCGEFEKNFKISNSIIRDKENEDVYNPTSLDHKLEDYQKKINKIIKNNKEKIDEYKLDLLSDIGNITKKTSFAYNQYFEKKLDNEMRKIGIDLEFKKDIYNKTEEKCSFCSKNSNNILYDYFDNKYKLCKNCEAALSDFYPHNYVIPIVKKEKK